MNRREQLEFEISSRSDWSVTALNEFLGGLTAQDFVNVYEFGGLDMALDWDDNLPRLMELTGLASDPEVEIFPGYKTSLLGFYDTIGMFIASDREERALSVEDKFKRDQVMDAFLESQERIRELFAGKETRIAKIVRERREAEGK